MFCLVYSFTVAEIFIMGAVKSTRYPESFTVSSTIVPPNALVIVQLENRERDVPLYIQASIDTPLQSNHFYQLLNQSTEDNETDFSWRIFHEVEHPNSNVTFCPNFYERKVPKVCHGYNHLVYPFSYMRKTCIDSEFVSKKEILLSDDEADLNISLHEVAHGLLFSSEQPIVKFKWLNTDSSSPRTLHIGLQSHPQMMLDCKLLLENSSRLMNTNVSSFKVTIHADVLECVYWDETESKWASDGCLVSTCKTA